jgi:ATP-binding cassette subfamily B protein
MDKNNNPNNRKPPEQNQNQPRPFGGGGPPPGMMGRPIEKPKNMWKTIKRMFMYLGTQKIALIGLISMVIMTSVLSLIMTVLQKEAINTITIENGFSVDFSQLRLNLIYMGILFAVSSGINLVQGLLSASVSQKKVKIMRNDMMNKMQDLQVKYFDTHTHGELMSRLTNDVDNVSTCVSQSISSLFSSVITIVGSLAMMLYYSRVMTVISLVVVPVGIFVTKKNNG